MTRRWAVNLSGPDSKCVRAKAPDCRNRDWHPPARDEGCRLLPQGTRAHQQFDPPPYRIHRQKPTNHNRQSMAKVRRRSADQRTKHAESDDRNWSYKSACLVTATARATKTESARAKKGLSSLVPFLAVAPCWFKAGPEKPVLDRGKNHLSQRCDLWNSTQTALLPGMGSTDMKRLRQSGYVRVGVSAFAARP